MRHMEFYNREKEMRELTGILSTDPTLITFIYGPINSGKPVCLVELVNTQNDRKGIVEEMLKIRKGQMEDILYSLEDRDKKVFDAVMEVISELIGKERVGYKYLSNKIKFLVGKNIIFVDSVNKELRPQSRLSLLAIREVISDA